MEDNFEEPLDNKTNAETKNPLAKIISPTNYTDILTLKLES